MLLLGYFMDFAQAWNAGCSWSSAIVQYIVCLRGLSVCVAMTTQVWVHLLQHLFSHDPATCCTVMFHIYTTTNAATCCTVLPVLLRFELLKVCWIHASRNIDYKHDLTLPVFSDHKICNRMALHASANQRLAWLWNLIFTAEKKMLRHPNPPHLFLSRPRLGR